MSKINLYKRSPLSKPLELFRSSQSWSSYWATQSEVLFFGEISKITDGKLYNQKSGATDFLTVAGVAGSYTFQCPNTAPYIAADTDYIWFKTDETPRITTEAELIGYDLQRTPVKYDNVSPYAIRWVMILKSGEVLSATKIDKLHHSFDLPLYWSGILNSYGVLKGNRGLVQKLWTPENVYQDETVALLARMDTQPSLALAQLIDKTILDLKTAGIWAITDKLHKWDLHTTQASLLDWKNAIHNATNSGSPTYTPKVGVLTAAASSNIDLHFVPSTDCTAGSLDSLAYSLDDIDGTINTAAYNFGAYNQANDSYLVFRTRISDAAPQPRFMVNSTNYYDWNNQAGNKLWYCERYSDSAIRIYQSAASTSGEGSNASVSMVNRNLTLGAYTGSNGAVNRNAIKTSTFWLGSCFTADQKTAWYSIIAYWKANIGGTF